MRFSIARVVTMSCLAMALCVPAYMAGAVETITGDVRRETVGGVSFTAPEGWRLEVRGPATLLTPPEDGSVIAFVDVQAEDADVAVAEAWATAGLEAKWPLKVAVDQPAREGWEKVRSYSYETSANERRYVHAMALFANDAWTVAIVDFSEPVLDKRYAQFLLVVDRLHPRGYARESFAGRKANTLDAARIEALSAFVREAQRELGIPGVSIGLVQAGKVVFAGGFGVRELGKSVPVDADTLYIIASNTKAMTTLMLARLVDRGLIDWKTPVTRLLPGFALGDEATTRRVLVEHLVCACTGLPRQDYEWLLEFANATPETTLKTLATMQPTSDFGALYQYSNPLASAGGYAGAHVLFPDLSLGEAYDRAMREEVFAPLGMDDTTFDFDTALAGNHAAAHAWDVAGETQLANMPVNYAIVPVRPAGGAWSSVNDVLRYVQMELANGLDGDGERYVSEPALLERRRQQVAVGNDESYGMGLSTNRTWGIPVVEHGGSMIGYKSNMLWLPEHGVGAVILTNSDQGGMLLGPFQRRLLELLFDGNPEAEEDVAASARRMRDWLAAELPRLEQPASEEAAASLASRYANAALGTIDVVRKGDRTVFDLGEWQSEVASRRNDDGTMSFVTLSPGITGLDFVVGEEGGRKRLTLRSSQQEYVFEAR